VQVVVRNVLHVEPPAWVLTGAERIVDHVTDGGDARGAETVECLRPHPEEFVGPQQIGLFALGNLDEIAVEAIHTGADGETMGDLADQGVARLVAVRVERDDLMAEPLQRPEAIE
jgi:hypothetical protein